MQQLQRLLLVVFLATGLVVSPIQADISSQGVEITYKIAQAVDPSCPSLEWARANLHSDVVLKGESRCAYHMARNDGAYSATVTYKSGWIVNAAEPDELVYVQIGDDTQHLVKAATWWQCEGPCTQRALDIACAGMREFAALPQNNFAGSVRCRGSSAGLESPTTVAVSATGVVNNTFNGVQLTPIEGGLKYVGPTYTGPAPCRVYYGQPAQWYEPGQMISASVFSLYGC